MPDGERRLARRPMRWRLNWPSDFHLVERALHAADGVVRVRHAARPRSAMIPSPMNLSSVPSYLKIVSTISSKYSLSISTMRLGRACPRSSRVKPRMSLLKTVQLLDELPALLHLELAADHLLGDVRRDEPLEALAHDDLLLDLLGEDGVLDEHRGLAGDRRDELEVLRLELGERLASRARATPRTSFSFS